MYVSPDGIAYRERPYDVTGRHIPIPGGINLIRPPYLPNSNSRQKPRHIPNAGNEGSSAADRMKAVIHIFVTLKACSLALPHHSSIVVVVVLVLCECWTHKKCSFAIKTLLDIAILANE
jgi:hypothetical protein